METEHSLYGHLYCTTVLFCLDKCCVCGEMHFSSFSGYRSARGVSGNILFIAVQMSRRTLVLDPDLDLSHDYSTKFMIHKTGNVCIKQH